MIFRVLSKNVMLTLRLSRGQNFFTVKITTSALYGKTMKSMISVGVPAWSPVVKNRIVWPISPQHTVAVCIHGLNLIVSNTSLASTTIQNTERVAQYQNAMGTGLIS